MTKLPHLYQTLPVVFLSTISIFVYIITKLHQPAYSTNLSENIQISASIGQSVTSLYGYTAPFSQVFLEGSPLSGAMETTSRDDGYFIFTHIYMLSQTKELCLRSHDRSSRSTNPVCIPAPPMEKRSAPIGPIILPPTISIKRQFFLPGETVETSGESIPNTTLKVVLFRNDPTIFELINQKLLSFTHILLPKPVYATLLPDYSVTTDRLGNFSFNLPSNVSNSFRIFSQASFHNNPSPKSNTLSFKVLTLWEYALSLFLIIPRLLFGFLKKIPFLNFLLISELLIILFLIFRSLVNKRRSMALTIVNNKLSLGTSRALLEQPSSLPQLL